MTEIWKSIDDRYSVSNLGRVKSNYANKERILRPTTNAYGYLMVDLRHKGTRKGTSVHRLVAYAFVPNPDPENFNEVNHKDEDKTNNCADNLEWCNTKYNCNYGTRNRRKAEGCRKPICSVDKNGNVIHYDSVIEASELTGLNGPNISKALSKNSSHNKTAGGMLWFYDDGNIDQIVRDMSIRPNANTRRVYSMDTSGKIKYYESVSKARKETGAKNIIRSINKGCLSGGRRWFYDE